MEGRSSLAGLLIWALSAVTFGLPREYHLIKEKKTWREAQLYCRKSHTDLAFISNQQEADQLAHTALGHRSKDRNRGKSWYREECRQERPFVCFDLGMVLVRETKTWEEALEHCRKNYADLSSLLSPEEDQQAQALMTQAQTDHVWTGLRYVAGWWMWVNGDPLQHRSWEGGAEPLCPAADARCGTLPRGGRPWGTRDCGERRNFLCSK